MDKANSASGNNPTPKTPGYLARLAAILGWSPSEAGTARLAAAIDKAPVPVITRAEAFRKLLPTIEDSLRQRAGMLYSEYVRLDLTGGSVRQTLSRFNEWQSVLSAADLARDMQASSWLTDHCLAYAATKGHDPLTHGAYVVRGWLEAGKPMAEKCPECGSPMVTMPAEREDAESGLGAVDAGPVCTHCDYDGRTAHKPTSRGSDAPFLG